MFLISRKFSLRSGLWGALTVVLLGMVLTRCAQNQVAGDDAEGIYKEAEEAFKDERYIIALEKFREVKNRYPYSNRATDSELRIADTYFAEESYIESESAYEIFKELHPTHPKSDYVQYRMALSYYMQIPDNAARDLSAAFKAIDAFENLFDKYPNSEFVAKGKEYIVEARKRLAEHEAYVADFYFRRQHYLSASYRYAALLKDYSNLGFDEEALYRLGESYYHIRMFDNARDTLTRLTTEFPNSGYKGEATALLEELKNRKNQD
jgi:outer membrane protein assembly factor BamD